MNFTQYVVLAASAAAGGAVKVKSSEEVLDTLLGAGQRVQHRVRRGRPIR